MAYSTPPCFKVSNQSLSKILFLLPRYPSQPERLAHHKVMHRLTNQDSPQRPHSLKGSNPVLQTANFIRSDLIPKLSQTFGLP